MVREIMTTSSDSSNKITRDQYDRWRHGYVLDGLRGLRYGQSFCNEFGITDNILFYSRDQIRADRHIRKYYVKRRQAR